MRFFEAAGTSHFPMHSNWNPALQSPANRCSLFHVISRGRSLQPETPRLSEAGQNSEERDMGVDHGGGAGRTSPPEFGAKF